MLQTVQDGRNSVQSPSRDRERRVQYRWRWPREPEWGRRRGYIPVHRHRSACSHPGTAVRGEWREEREGAVEEKFVLVRGAVHRVPVVRLQGANNAARSNQTPEVASQHDHTINRTSYLDQLRFSTDEEVPGVVRHLGQAHEVVVLQGGEGVAEDQSFSGHVPDRP